MGRDDVGVQGSVEWDEGMGKGVGAQGRWDGRMGMAVGAQGTAGCSVLGWGVPSFSSRLVVESRAAPARLGRC